MGRDEVYRVPDDLCDLVPVAFDRRPPLGPSIIELFSERSEDNFAMYFNE